MRQPHPPSLNAVGGGVAGDFAVEVLPGIARDVWAWWGKDKSEAQRRADIQALAALPPAAMRKAVDQAVAEVASDKPRDERARLAGFVNMVPEAIHLSLCRPGDPRGLTVPANLPLQRAEGPIPFLPRRLPRFNPGDRPLPGVGLPSRVVPGPEGSVIFEWQDPDGTYTEVEIDRPLHAEVLLIQPGEPASSTGHFLRRWKKAVPVPLLGPAVCVYNLHCGKRGARDERVAWP